MDFFFKFINKDMNLKNILLVFEECVSYEGTGSCNKETAIGVVARTVEGQ